MPRIYMNSFIQLIARHRVLASALFLAIFPFVMPYEALACLLYTSDAADE